MLQRLRRDVINVGGAFAIQGLGFTSGSVVNFFVATARGPINAGPLPPSTISSIRLIVPVPPGTPLGQGFVSVQVVNTDHGFCDFQVKSALLQGLAAAGIPSLTSIDGVDLAATSRDPHFAVNNVETVVMQGSAVALGGSGFDITDGVAAHMFCACPGGKVGPFLFDPGDPGLSAKLIALIVPASGPNAPLTGPGSFVVSNKGGDGKFSRKSNAVSVPIGDQVSVTSVSQSATTISVDGSGLSQVTVINFFNLQGLNVVNLGGLKPDGTPRIPLSVVSERKIASAGRSVR